MKVTVKNYKSGDTSNNPTCKCESWIDHWNRNRYPDGSKQAGYCRCCNNKLQSKDLIGGHVIKVFGNDKSRFIVPLCYSCNSTNNTKEFSVESEDLISANVWYCRNI